jgi:hypothetical protein
MPSHRRALLLVTAVITGLALVGCSVNDDGPRTTQTRDLAAFTRIDNEDSVEVRLHVGEPQRVQVLAGENVIDDVRTEVYDGTLRVTFDHNGFGGSSVTVEASVAKLTGVESSGSGEVDVDGVDADAFEVRSDGSGHIGLQGAVGRLAVDLGGSGDADLAGLQAREARVVVDGSGNTAVRAAEQLDVNMDGSGDVHYYGDPEVTQRRDGSGDISRAD